MKKRKESEPISSEKNLQKGLKTEGEVSVGKGIERGVENGRERKADDRDAVSYTHLTLPTNSLV